MDSHSTSVRPALLARSTSPGSAVKHLAVKGQIVGKMRSFPKPGEVTLDSFSSGGVASGELAGNQSVEPTQVRVHRDDSLALIVDPVGQPAEMSLAGGLELVDATVENCRKVIDEVKPKNTKFTIEMMGWSLPDSPDSYLDLIRAVDRQAFAVHVDVCNLINSPRRFYNNADLIAEVFRKLGKWVVSCHAKDLQWIPEMNVHFVKVVPGRGEMDYRVYLRELARLPADAPLMLEHLKTAEEYEEGKNYILKVGAGMGVKFA